MMRNTVQFSAKLRIIGIYATNYVCQKVGESFCTISFEYHRESIRHLGCMNVLAYECICGPVSMSYRSSETNFL